MYLIKGAYNADVIICHWNYGCVWVGVGEGFASECTFYFLVLLMSGKHSWLHPQLSVATVFTWLQVFLFLFYSLTCMC